MKRQTILLIFVQFIFVFNLRSQDSTLISNDTLETITISSSYLAQKETPFTYTNLYNRKLDKINYGQEASFILSQTPSITAYSDAGNYQGYSYFRIRGIDQTRINMTLDGVPLNEPEDQGVYFSNYPDFLNSIGQLQIQRGVGTSKNGSASYGGSVQFTSPKLSEKAKKEIGIGYGSYNQYRIYGEFNSGLKKNKGLYLRASHLHADGYKERSANTSSSVFYSAGIFNKNATWKATGFIGTQKNELAWLGVSQAEIDLNPKTNANTEEDDKFSQALLQLQHISYLSESSTLQASIYYNFLDGNYDFDLNNFLGLPPTPEMFNYALSSHFIGGFSNYTYEKDWLTAVAGFHLNRYERTHEGSERTIGYLYRNTGFKNEISIFTKATIEVGLLTFLADLQWRKTNFDYDGNVELDQLDWTFFNPKFGITITPNTNFNIYYSIGKTGREPTRTDLFKGNDNLGTDLFGNPDLGITEAEYVVDHELGLRITRNIFKANLNIFYMDFRDEIVLNGQFGPNGLALNENVDKSYRSGLEFDIKYLIFKRLAINQNLAYTHSKIEDAGITFEPILTPSFIFNNSLSYPIKAFTISLDARYQSSSYIDFANEEKIDGYVLLNARVRYALKKFSATVFLNNLNNKQYYNNGYVDFDGTPKYFIQAPFHIFTALTYTF